MMRRPLPVLFCLAVVSLVGGCAHYEYDVVQPTELAQHVGTKQWATFRVDELEYRLITSDNRLVALVYNRGERTVKLSGADSAAIDPQGESHPQASRIIPPGTHTRLILPPPLPQVHSYGPSLGFGVGATYGRHYGSPYHYGGYGYGTSFYDDFEPRYYSVYDANDRTYFEWPGNTEIWLLL